MENRGVRGWWWVYAVIVIALALFTYGFEWWRAVGRVTDGLLSHLPVWLLAMTYVAWRTQDRWRPGVTGVLARHTESVDSLPEHRLGLWIAVAAGLGLFAELMIIRIHASYFQVFAYFKNISLLSCFLGLGIGYTWSKRALLTPLFLPALGLQILAMHALRLGRLTDALQNPVTEELSFGIGAVEGTRILTVYGFLILVFAFNALCFVPLGQLASRLMARQPKLTAYSWNLLGSLGGIGLFYAMSYLWAPPPVWLAATCLVAILFLRGQTVAWFPSLVAGLLTIAAVGVNPNQNERDIFSPYQQLTLLVHRSAPPEVRVSHVYYQRILELDSLNVASDPALARWANHYQLPYRFMPEPDRVLIVGAGTGNDVAAAVRAGAGSVDAVEIDPAILQFGRLLHPEGPYQKPNVRATVADARAFIRHASDRYNLIVYGLLDSHALLSGRAGVRLDSFVYTVEGFREARARLADGGLICLTFSLIRPSLGQKLYAMLQQAFDGEQPLVYQSGYDGGYTFIIGDDMANRGLVAGDDLTEVSADFGSGTGDVDVSTDDWPFFYMPRRDYPSSYVVLIVVLVLVSVTFVLGTVPGAGRGMSGSCFFLGAGFMLVETKSITELALVFGSTWVVIGVVITGILVMAFLANLLVIRLGAPPPVVTYGLLIGSLVIGLAITSDVLSQLPPWLGALTQTTVLTMPLFFSGFAFSRELKHAPSVAVALSSNLLGAMVGGFVEYNSMYLGFRSLYFIAIGVYALAWLMSVGRGSRAQPAAAEV